MLGFGAVGTVAFIALMAALAWASSLTGGGATEHAAFDLEAKTITTSVRSEFPNLDSTRLTDTYGEMLLGHVMEGLLRYDIHGKLVPGVAERWEVRAGGATFWLRESSMWSDGKPVTAHDFVFAWQKVVDPENASEYAAILYVVKNGERVVNGELPPSELRVWAEGDHVLEVEFENPTIYFEKLAAFTTLYPIREDFYRARNGRYAADAEDLLYNGPFRVTEWVHGASLHMEKNPSYWDRNSIHLNAIDIGYITNDAVARLNLFQDGRIIDVDHIPGEAMDQVLQQRWRAGSFNDGSVWFLELNQRPGRLLENDHFRKALQLASDSDELVYKVLKNPAYKVAESLFPAFLSGVDGPFRDEYPPPRVETDIAAARKHLEIAKQELGLDEFPPLVLLGDDTPAAIVHSEYLQDRFRRTLGLELRLDRQTFKLRIAKAQEGDFDIVIYGWGPDYDDPMTFGDYFASWNPNNHGRYSNTELDDNVRIAQRSDDQRERMAAFGEIQRILIEDAALILNYDRSVMFVQDPHLKGVSRPAVGPEPDYTRAYLVENP